MGTKKAVLLNNKSTAFKSEKLCFSKLKVPLFYLLNISL